MMTRQQANENVGKVVLAPWGAVKIKTPCLLLTPPDRGGNVKVQFGSDTKETNITQLSRCVTKTGSSAEGSK